MQKCIRASGINTFNAVSGLVSKGLQYACTPSYNRASVKGYSSGMDRDFVDITI